MKLANTKTRKVDCDEWTERHMLYLLTLHLHLHLHLHLQQVQTRSGREDCGPLQEVYTLSYHWRSL